MSEHLEMSIEWWLEKRASPWATSVDVIRLGHNEMTTGGLQYLLDFIRGTNAQSLNASNAYIGVGSSAAAFSLAQTDLQGTVSGSTAITGATNATPIVISTAAAHGLTTSNNVTITGALGNTAANGSWQVASVPTSTTFSLSGSVGNGAWTSGGTYAVGVGNGRVRRPMEPTFPSRTGTTLNFQSSFGASEANWGWSEWGLFVAAPANTMISRRVQALGTKTAPNVWTLTAHLALA
jgi:hypothetical protein